MIAVNKFIEKPGSEAAPSNYAIMARYGLIPEIFDLLGENQIGASLEIQLTEAIQKLKDCQSLFALEFDGPRYDVGEKFGFNETTIEFALKRPVVSDQLLDLFERKLKESHILKANNVPISVCRGTGISNSHNLFITLKFISYCFSSVIYVM